MFGNNSQKGSLLIYPRVEATPRNSDTLITLTNDSSLPVLVKCYYATSDPLPTPYSGTHRVDVQFAVGVVSFSMQPGERKRVFADGRIEAF